MPRPEQQRIRAPEGAPYGSTAELQRLNRAVPPAEQQPAAPPGRPPEEPLDISSPMASEDDKALEALLFGPSERPDEPITAGASFGPGPSFVPSPGETRFGFMQRVASALADSPAATNQAKRFAERIRRGE